MTAPCISVLQEPDNAGLRDAVVIVLVCAVCASAYVGGLRYYSDDYLFLVPLQTHADQSWSGLYRALAAMPYAAVRPGQIAWYVALHKLAHDSALVSHLANHVVFVAGALWLHAALRKIPATRPGAYYVTLLYACMATFSVAKMWYANHQAVISLALFAATAWLVATLATESDRRRWPLVGAVALTSAAGNLFYELFAVTELLLPLFVWCALRPGDWTIVRDRRLAAATVAVAAGFLASTALKLPYDYGFDLPAAAQTLPAYLHRAAAMYYGAARTTFWTLGMEAPRVAVSVMRGPYLQPGSILAPAAVAVLVASREYLASWGRPAPSGQEAGFGFYTVTGVAAFGLGYVPYLANFLYSPKPWGEGNRGNIAGALGAALLAFALYRWLRRRAPLPAAVLLVLWCAAGAFLQVAVGRMWDRAAQVQDSVLARFDAATRGVPDGATVLVYGSCPYYGAGPVFPYGWDLAGRQTLRSGRRLSAAIMMPDMRVDERAISTPPGRWAQAYAYDRMWIADLQGGSSTRIDGPRAAGDYLSSHPLSRAITCRFDFGVGNPLF